MGEVVTFPVLPRNRLQVAISRLMAAQAEQRLAVQSFQDSMQVLRAETSRLGRSLQQLDGELGAVGRKVDKAREASRTLTETAARL